MFSKIHILSTAALACLTFATSAFADPVKVDLDNYPYGETPRQVAITQDRAGGINTFDRKREVPSIDDQPVIRMNRDTLYSMAIIDASKGATVTLPDAGDRYISLMFIDENHRVSDMIYEPGEYEVPASTNYLYAIVRIGIGSGDVADLEEVHGIQDEIKLSANSAVPFEPVDFDKASYDETHHGLLDKFTKSGLLDTEGMFGTEDYVDHDKYLMGTAAGWGGATWKDNIYQISPYFEGAECMSTTFEDPNNEGGFWSITVYDKKGFMFDDVAHVNSKRAKANEDGTYTVHFGCEGEVNNIPSKNDTGSWHAEVRHYVPSQAVMDRKIVPMDTIEPVK
jgi:hypothetical protein